MTPSDATAGRFRPAFNLSSVLAGLWLIVCSSSGPLTARENVDPAADGSQFVYAENLGWLNGEPLGDGGPGVEVGDSRLGGYLWSENVGWISLSCTNTLSCGTVDYGVTNDGNGVLSGVAWGENVGWINFAPAGVSVTIDALTGQFSGRAWGENVGWMTFASVDPVPYRMRAGCPDADADGVPALSFLCPGGSTVDCNDGIQQVWATPGEVRSVTFASDGQTLAWLPPADPGGTSLVFDTIRSPTPGDFVTVAICLESNDGLDTQAVDTATPSVGGAFMYLIRAENGCPAGHGPLGFRSDGTPRTGLDCP